MSGFIAFSEIKADEKLRAGRISLKPDLVNRGMHSRFQVFRELWIRQRLRTHIFPRNAHRTCGAATESEECESTEQSGPQSTPRFFPNRLCGGMSPGEIPASLRHLSSGLWQSLRPGNQTPFVGFVPTTFDCIGFFAIAVWNALAAYP